jgi:hypothetical protein
VGCLESFASGVCIIGTSLHQIDQIGIGFGRSIASDVTFVVGGSITKIIRTLQVVAGVYLGVVREQNRIRYVRQALEDDRFTYGGEDALCWISLHARPWFCVTQCDTNLDFINYPRLLCHVLYTVW